MAYISARVGFDQNFLDLSQLSINSINVNYEDNINFTLYGRTYQDVYEVVWDDGTGTYSSVFGGTGITMNQQGSVTGGVVTGYVASYWTGSGYAPAYAFQDVSLSAAGLYRAAQTAGTADDYALINAALAGADTFDMSAEGDRIFGLGGNDTMRGNGGADTIDGGSGDDLLYGGLGRDVVVGGIGSDRFIFSRANETGATAVTADAIRDFAKGVDKIDLSAIDAFAATGGTNDVFVFRGTAAFGSASAGEVRFQKFDLAGTVNDYTMVWIDTDANSSAEAAIKLNGLYTLTASDFIL